MNIIKPIITEKTIRLAEDLNQYTFEVRLDTNKSEAAKELEQMFDVKVGKVQVNRRLGKTTKFGRTRKTGKKADRKIMIFKLAKGQIDIFRS